MFYRIFTVVKKNCRTILKPIFSNLIHQNTHKHIHYLYIYIYILFYSPLLRRRKPQFCPRGYCKPNS